MTARRPERHLPVAYSDRGRAEGERRWWVAAVAVGAVAVGLLVCGTADVVERSQALVAVAALLASVALVLLLFHTARLSGAASVIADTDVLTGLYGRRRLLADLEVAFREATPERPWLFALVDLDGFRKYNDRFGHPAGDRLLSHLAAKLRAALADTNATGYSLGGDEFCVLTTLDGARVDEIVDRAVVALSEGGGGFSIGCSLGRVTIPGEAASEADVLALADGRLYEEKFRKHTVREQAHEPLLQALFAREPGLEEHVTGVTELALDVGNRIGLGARQLSDLGLVAKLHDIGKLAVPDAILEKPYALTGDEATFIRDHAGIGERILASAPSLARLAPIVRATHERWDGAGYPDGLAGEQIPLLARIVCACDAAEAMRADRPYRPHLTVREIVAELRRCSGTQFDPAVASTLVAVLNESLEPAERDVPRATPVVRLTPRGDISG